MRINREHRLYLAFEASEILSLQHGSCHMGPYSQPTWHLLRSTPANDTYLLPPMMLPPTQVTCHLLSFKSNTVSLLLCFWYFVMLHYSYSFNSIDQLIFSNKEMKQQTVRHEWQNKITYPHIMHNCHKCLQFDWFNWTGCVGDDKKVTGTIRCVSWFCRTVWGCTAFKCCGKYQLEIVKVFRQFINKVKLC